MTGSALLILLLLCLLLRAFFSGAETVMIRFKAAQERVSEETRAVDQEVSERDLAEHERLLIVTQVGSTLVTVIGTILLYYYLLPGLGHYAEIVTLVITVPVLVVFGEVVPRVLFQHYTGRIAPRLPGIVALWRWLLFPFVLLVNGCVVIFRSLISSGADTSTAFASREELQLLFTDPGAAAELPTHERQMIDRIFDFSETVVEDTMVPLIEVQAFDQDTTVAAALPKIIHMMHTRYPVYRNRIDEIIGTLYSIDLIDASSAETQVGELMRPCVYVPETVPVSEVLARMQKENFSMAVAVDEYGGCTGVIYREDILEEIVGQMEDEYDKEPPMIQMQREGQWVVNARVELSRLDEEIGLELPDGPYETLAGFLLTRFMRIPKAGEKLYVGDWSFQITRADERSIEEILLRREIKSPDPSPPQ